MDSAVDALPRDAEGLLIRMWCLCHIEGSCPDDDSELARKTRCSVQYVSQCKPHCQSLFELRSGRLYSRRMEAEKRRSAQASKNAKSRYSKGHTESALQTADQSAVPIAEQSALPRPDSDSHVLKEKESVSSKEQGFNSTEVAQMLCQRNGWSGRDMLWSLERAIEFQSQQMTESGLERVGEWLVSAYSKYRSEKGTYAVIPQKYFEQGLYHDAGPVCRKSQSEPNPAQWVSSEMGVQ
jgi:uncharacterized protein YdaU (DUF1376 family)